MRSCCCSSGSPSCAVSLPSPIKLIPQIKCPESCNNQVYLQAYYISNSMNYPFIEGLSDIQDTEALTRSHLTSAFTAGGSGLENYLNFADNDRPLLVESRETGYCAEPELSFYELRDYIEKTLSSWGLRIGYMHENEDNKATVACLMGMIEGRFKAQESRDELKKSLAQAQYQKNKYQSLLEQQRATSADRNKTIGKLENSLVEYKNKLKQLEMLCKKEKQQDRKTIAALKSKNDKIMHEIKKREQESAKIKDQMKKNVGERNSSKQLTFEVYQVLPRVEPDSSDDRLASLAAGYEKEKKMLLKENLLLREKIYDIRQQIVGFAEWIDVNLFKEPSVNYRNKIIVNHNMLFRKESIVDEFRQILDNARSGMKQLMEMNQGGIAVHMQSSAKPRTFASEPYQCETSPLKMRKQSQEQWRVQSRDTLPVQRNKLISNRHERTQQKKMVPASGPNLPRPTTLRQSMPVEMNDTENEISIISHVSMQDIINEPDKFNKWDILFNND